MSTVDELFSGEAPVGEVDATVRIGWWIVAAWALTLLGPCVCVTSVPGALAALWAWTAADDEVARVDRGGLPEARRPKLLALRQRAYRGMVMASVLCTVQLVLWADGTYIALLNLLLQVWQNGPLAPLVPLGYVSP